MLKLSVLEFRAYDNKKKRIKILHVFLVFFTALLILCIKTYFILSNNGLYMIRLNTIKHGYLLLIVYSGFILFPINYFSYANDFEKAEIDMNNIYLNTLSSSLQYISIDIQKEMVFISKKLADTLGYHGSGLISYKDYCKEYIHPDDLQKAISIDETRNLLSLDSSVKYRLKNRQGVFELFQSERAIVSDDDGNPNNIIEIYQNINDTVNYYRNRENNRIDFINYLCHEFKTPLNVVLGAIQLLELMDKNKKETNSSDVFNDKLNRYIKLIKQNTYRLIRLINNTLDITKFDNRYLSLDLSNEDIVKLVKNIVMSVDEYINKNNIKLTFSSEIEEKIIACDKDKIERIILNLLSNAIKYTDSGGNININIWEKEGKVYILVEDTGIGIPHDLQKDIFDIYKQVNIRSKREKQGSGIGLSLVKSILELHGGRIWVESEVNKGSKFYVELPDKIIESGYVKEKIGKSSNEMVEKIHIEFSDIYSL